MATIINKLHRASRLTHFENNDVAATFQNYPAAIKKKLLFLRQLIFDTASATGGVGLLTETLKWGQPSYVTAESKSGSTIRIDQIKSRSGQYAIYFHCQTTLVDTFKEMFGNKFRYEGNRSIVFEVQDKVPVRELRYCIALAFTYHLAKLKSPPSRKPKRGPAHAPIQLNRNDTRPSPVRSRGIKAR
ncbi:MAG TPA: DUF1801 domain-containing protein [Burkholderiales bacterium]|nr:DUF1801 domain-containing protein [Burkholderiales bacterium]